VITYENQKRFGVLDIGSNSIRLVVFRKNTRIPLIEFNEKAFCGLGTELQIAGKLSEQGKLNALDNISRFAAIIEKMGLQELQVIATAAVRDASDGKEFIKELENFFDFSVKILSGKEEAYLSALGVICAFPNSTGIACDLGGGSLELASIKKGRIYDCTSLPIGSLRFAEINECSEAKTLNLIDEWLEAVDWLQNENFSSIYAIGGAWRSLARLHMEFADYELKVIHGYSVKQSELTSFLEQLYPITVSTKKPDDQALPPISSSRAKQIPIASLILSRIIYKVNSRRVVFSAAGLREGCLFDRLDQQQRELDPLMSSLMAIFPSSYEDTLYSRELEHLICSFFPNMSLKYKRLLRAICCIRNIGSDEHPSYRSLQSYLRLLRLPVIGITHKERVFIATAILNRYNGSNSDIPEKVYPKIITSEEHKMASMIGFLLDFAIGFSGGLNGVLDKVQVKRDRNAILMLFPKEMNISKGQNVKRRVKRLERVFGEQVILQAV
tara:strand:+ start:410 stop:1903 length:1494 start_codon:yes stop_codon:yes gene_type:complete